MTAYRKGYEAERRAKQMLERMGFTVITSRGSHGPIDLAAWDSERILLIQVKRNCYLSRVERSTLKTMPRPRNAVVQCWRFTGRGKPDVEIL